MLLKWASHARRDSLDTSTCGLWFIFFSCKHLQIHWIHPSHVWEIVMCYVRNYTDPSVPVKIKSKWCVLGFVQSSSIPCYPYMCFGLFGLLCFIVIFVFCQPPPAPPYFLFLFIYTALLLSSSFFSFIIIIIIISLPVLFFPHMVSPLSSPLLSSPLLSSPLFSTPFPPPTPDPSCPCLSLRLPSITISQRHSQTGGGVKRWWAPGNPRGAFQWQRPQVKIPWAELLGCSSRPEEK